jgi:transcriptional regulator with XRE-family HTH domain
MSDDKKEFARKIGSKIRENRIMKGLTMQELAHMTNMEYIQLSRIELGKINTSCFTIFIISKTLNLNFSELFI